MYDVRTKRILQSLRFIVLRDTRAEKRFRKKNPPFRKGRLFVEEDVSLGLHANQPIRLNQFLPVFTIDDFPIRGN
jgi:hypothetical protein